MSRIKYFILFILLCFPAVGMATTQYYYLTPLGAGGNASDTGTWESAPTSEGQAMTANNFNTAANW